MLSLQISTRIGCYIFLRFGFGILFLCVCQRWWASKVLSRIPAQDRDEVMLKAAAFDCLGGKRKNWALQTRWRGNYLAEVIVEIACFHCFAVVRGRYQYS